MYEPFEVVHEGVLNGTPEQVWDAITVHTGGWLWPVSYADGVATGLASTPGEVLTAEPHRRFTTRHEREDGWWSRLDHELEPGAGGVTLIRYRHRGVFTPQEYAVQLDQCRQHTDFYMHSLGQYVRHFAGRDATYASIDDAPADARARLAERGDLGVVDYDTHAFLGLRGEDAMIRVYDRRAWGYGVQVVQHGFDGREGAWLDEFLTEVAR
jgi:uncharacterized protein YndB with AHSA1/START domain